MSGISDVNSQSLGPQENVVVIDLEELEDLLLVGRIESVRESHFLSINDSLVEVVQFDLVSSQLNGDSEFVSRDFAGIDSVSWSGSTVTADECWALGHVSVVGQVVESLNGASSDITIGIQTELETGNLDRLESGGDWIEESDGEGVEVNSVEVFVLSFRSVEVDVSLWVVSAEVKIDSNASTDEVALAVSVMFGMIVNDTVLRDPIGHQEGGDDGSRSLPSVAGFNVDLVVDGDVGLAKFGLFEGSSGTDLSSRVKVTWVLSALTLFTALLVWPSVSSSLGNLGLRAVTLANVLDVG
jgi:hypothetical protein